MIRQDLLIRPAVETDIDAVRRLLRETWHDTYDGLLGRERVVEITERWHAVEVLARQIRSSDGSFLIAIDDHDVVGHGHAQVRTAGTLTLSRLYVLPGRQRQGIGGRLLAALIARHPETMKVELNVEPQNEKAIAFYRRHGFAACGEALEDGVKALRMERLL